ncbi:FAD-binding protein [Novipirellula artificiosorum]|uniref:Putative FAD-linked oxidoreductase n=1 Tax=Novipirellula artificiosorum TaxID=2528016 RepID=A0A5C6D9U4_9BACT|nr:FAD-binding protein [Novipirellula artificiosorum]TWU33692.1 putative FAD-linked oxidoreductase [Novipirellula artificiosorum]
MNDSNLVYPKSLDESVAALRESPNARVVGNQTKPPLCGNRYAGAGGPKISLSKLTGVTQYEPSEYTFTALAGTTLAELVDVLGEQRQYLPFDPMLVSAGATIGGTIAAGMAGPGRFRYGGIRDFLLGVTLILGNGDVVKVGGKVVKNAAGFDVPKFLINSLGRFGAMVDVTFKVFPKPLSLHTYAIECQSSADASNKIAVAASSRWELDAIDYRADDKRLYLRQQGPDEVNEAIAIDMQSKLGSMSRLGAEQATAFWSGITELSWQSVDSIVAKVPTTPRQLECLCETLRRIDGVSVHLSVAGSVAWVAAQDVSLLMAIQSSLIATDHSGLLVRGNIEGMTAERCYMNRKPQGSIEQSLLAAFGMLKVGNDAT